MVAARARGYYDQQAKARQGTRTDLKNIPENLPESRDARDAAGKAVGVSGKSVDFATRVLTRGLKNWRPRGARGGPRGRANSARE